MVKKNESSPEELMFSKVDSVDETCLVETPAELKRPTPADPAWTEWVLSHLTEREVRVAPNGNKLPTTFGLVRLVRKLIGNIINDESKEVFRNDNLSSVEHTFMIVPFNYNNESDYTITVTGVGDAANYGEDDPRTNTDAPFNRFLAACAETRAIGRSAKLALAINVCTAEELARVAEEGSRQESLGDYDRIRDSQKSVINNLVERNKIDLYKFIGMGKKKYTSLDKVSDEDAKGMITLLNQYQKNKPVPDEIKL